VCTSGMILHWFSMKKTKTTVPKLPELPKYCPELPPEIKHPSSLEYQISKQLSNLIMFQILIASYYKVNAIASQKDLPHKCYTTAAHVSITPMVNGQTMYTEGTYFYTCSIVHPQAIRPIN